MLIARHSSSLLFPGIAVFLTLIALAEGLSGQTIAITDVTVINPRAYAVLSHQTVIVERGRIRAIQDSSSKPPHNAQVIDGSQKFLIPGLWDAHVHLSKAGVLSLPLFVANGVTGVRDTGSDFQEVASWRTRIEAGELIGPRIKTSGQMLESKANIERMKKEGTIEPVDRLRIGVGNPEEGRAAVRRLAQEGVDHIKMRTTPDLATFLAVGDEAKRTGLPFAAHPVASPDDLMRAGLRSVEHLLAYPPLNQPFSERQALFRKMAAAHLFMSDTSVNLDALLSLGYADVRKRVDDANGNLDHRRKYVCGYLVNDWREQTEELKDPETVAEYGSLRKQLPQIQRDNREMREAGVEFLAGTDTAVVLMYPGFSLHDELQQLVRNLGFKPMEALRIAASNVADFYGQQQQFGALETGQPADVVLLDANPLADIGNTRKIHGVMTHGRWLDRAALDTLLGQVQEAATSGCHGLSSTQ